jgi:serpin B
MMDLLSRSAFVTLALAVLIGRPMNTLAANNNERLVEGNSAFALDLYARLKSADGNLFFSPYSISTCLAMTYAGARGDTAAQMARTLHFDTNQNQLAVSFGELQSQLNKARGTPGIELDIANGLWGQTDHRFVPAFLDLAGQKYEANLRQVDFRTGAETTRTEINDWVNHTTKGKISDLIQPGVLAPTTRLVLVNAIYFKGQWTHPFSKSNTLNAPFSVSANQKIEAPLMNLTAEFRYAEVEGLQLLELPYAGDGLSMVILLPKATDGLTSVEGLLKGQILDTWLAQARDQRVNVYLPKFKMSARFGLAPTLAEMGMSDAFSSRADFSGMDGERDLFISAVVHKAFVDVNEEGTEAAAATGTMMRSMAVFRPQPIPTFRADHPFILLIRDTHSGSILFLGRVVDPTRA